MDVTRTEAPNKNLRRLTWVGGGVAVVAALAFGMSQLPTAAPVVPRSSIWSGKVERGAMLREVRGAGVLTPVEFRWIPAPHAARVERIDIRPGTAVEASSVILELGSPEILQAASDSALAVQAAAAELASQTVVLEGQVLEQKSAEASIHAAAEEAERRLRVEEELARQGLTSTLSLELARTRANETKTRRTIEQRRVLIAEKAAQAQLAAARSKFDQLRSIADLRTRQRNDLVVRAGIRGIVQQVPVEVGQQIAAGTVVAKVAQPERLKAELRIPETQARDLQIGQSVNVDTRNGTVRGSVSRIDPASQNGTVQVDVELPAELPKGARPDLSVDGTIQLERLEGVLWMPRPLQVEENSQATLFRLIDGGTAAERVRVRIGRASASAVEILEGLEAGDEVVLSDMSQWSDAERLRIR